ANVERALEVEIARQTQVLRAGRRVLQESLLWDAQREQARPMRSKEESHDYRYYPDPDLPPLQLPRERIERIRAALPELPRLRSRRFVAQYAVPRYDADVLTAERALADYFEEVVSLTRDGKTASNWIMTDVLSQLKQRGQTITQFALRPAALAELIGLVTEGVISNTSARQLFAHLAESGGSARALVQREGLSQVRDSTQLERWAQEVVAANPAEADRFRSGDEKLLGFFMGQLMKKSKGQADPKLASELVRAALRNG
ncbi:MAG: Asp-tRNA(Asn)/Glu-tRNA(Gln) amidotransferase subunit GatB, partial [Longimicrobiales bacterium]